MATCSNQLNNHHLSKLLPCSVPWFSMIPVIPMKTWQRFLSMASFQPHLRTYHSKLNVSRAESRYHSCIPSHREIFLLISCAPITSESQNVSLDFSVCMYVNSKHARASPSIRVSPFLCFFSIIPATPPARLPNYAVASARGSIHMPRYWVVGPVPSIRDGPSLFMDDPFPLQPGRDSRIGNA